MITTEKTLQGEVIRQFDAKRGWWELTRKPDGAVVFKTPEGVTHNFADMEHFERYAISAMMEKTEAECPTLCLNT